MITLIVTSASLCFFLTTSLSAQQPPLINIYRIPENPELSIDTVPPSDYPDPIPLSAIRETIEQIGELNLWREINNDLQVFPIDSSTERYIKEIVFFAGVKMQLQVSKNGEWGKLNTVNRWIYFESKLKRVEGQKNLIKVLTVNSLVFSFSPMEGYRPVTLLLNEEEMTVYISIAKNAHVDGIRITYTKV